MNILTINNKLNIVVKPTQITAYDFNFELFYNCSHPIFIPEVKTAVLRIGALADYNQLYTEYLEQNIKLINSPEEHQKASELSVWYPFIEDLTPYSQCYKEFPSVEDINKYFDWPIFIKGSRQTSKHNPQLCIANNTQEYNKIIDSYKNDPILHWQDIVIRQFIPLMPIKGTVPNKITPSLEFRTFWWNKQCVGYGQYWYQLPKYQVLDIEQGINIAQQAANRLNTPFLVIDIAKTLDNQWVIIECNDAQESGYTGVIPQILWDNILSLLD